MAGSESRGRNGPGRSAAYRGRMRAFGVPVESGKPDDHRSDTSLVSLRSPLSGVVTERKFNAGAGIEAATPIFSISNLGTVYVIANVPETSMARLRVGSVAEITSPAIGTVSGRVSYIDPQLDETTRTGRVGLRFQIRTESFGQECSRRWVSMPGTNAESGEELVVPSSAVQRTGDKTVVFVPRRRAGRL
ncbi:MAG: efflux RND transporter periplasmic adaptor subunit [Acidobacteria bacterium]|nr:efflux RND transporter periplasmic adaptor subunit [Acidobacteriota bacterium]